MCKALGGRWDNDANKWYVPNDVDRSLFKDLVAIRLKEGLQLTECQMTPLMRMQRLMNTGWNS